MWIDYPKSGHGSSPAALSCKNIFVRSTWVECSCDQFLSKPQRAAQFSEVSSQEPPQTFTLPPWTAAGSSFLRVLPCETRAQYFCTDAKILCQSLKSGQIIWTRKIHSCSQSQISMSLNPLNQVKTFGHIGLLPLSHQVTRSLNPLNQVKSFGLITSFDEEIVYLSLNPLNQVKSFGPGIIEKPYQ